EKYYTEGLKAYSSGNMKEAIEKLGKASELSPGNEEIKNALTNAAKEGKLREGVKKDVQMWYNEGMKYFLQEDYDGAIVEFKKILDMNPDHPQAQEMIKKCRAKKK
ncbi:tetratricopeptide repeat protein, partial [bacterium]|nr:tetratricopeptide repeat protein [bacterium]